MNIRYARAATLVIPITAATAFPSPMSSSSSVSIRLEIEKTVAIVPTTFSFAIKPVIAAAASCQLTTPTTVGFLVYQIGTLITTGALGVGFVYGLIAIAVFAAVIVYLIQRNQKAMALEYKLD